MRRKRKQLELFPDLPTGLDPMQPIRWWAHYHRHMKSDRYKKD